MTSCTWRALKSPGNKSYSLWNLICGANTKADVWSYTDLHWHWPSLTRVLCSGHQTALLHQCWHTVTGERNLSETVAASHAFCMNQLHADRNHNAEHEWAKTTLTSSKTVSILTKKFRDKHMAGVNWDILPSKYLKPKKSLLWMRKTCLKKCSSVLTLSHFEVQPNSGRARAPSPPV